MAQNDTVASVEGFTEDVTNGDDIGDGPGAGDSTSSREDSPLSLGEWWSALFWLALGFSTIALVLQFAGVDLQLLAPGVVLAAYGLFVLWNPEAATSDAPITGVMWMALGIVGLVLIQAVELSWAFEVTGILVGFFLIFAGILVFLDL